MLSGVRGIGDSGSGSDFSNTNIALWLLTPVPTGSKENLSFVLGFERDGEGEST